MTKCRDLQIGLRGQLIKLSGHALDYHVLEQDFLSSTLYWSATRRSKESRNVTSWNSKKSCSYSILKVIDMGVNIPPFFVFVFFFSGTYLFVKILSFKSLN